MFKKILLFIIVPVALYLIGIVAINAINYQVNSSMSPDYYSIFHFNQNGNDFEGLFLLNGDVTQNSGEVISFSGVEKTCFKQIKGYYYNSQRGARWRPLDQSSLNYLQSINASYSGLNMEGGFRTSCSGEDEGNVYGQITHTYKGNTFKLLAGVDYNFDDGKYINHYSGNLNYVNIQDSFSMNGYVYDTWGGIGKLTSNINLVEGDYSITGAVSSGTIVNLTGNLTVMSSGYEGEINLSDIDIVVSGLDWDGIIIPPTVVDLQGSSGILDTGVLLFTTQVGASGTSLIASGGYFNISLYVSGYDVGGSLDIYRSQDNDVWSLNTPDSSCMIDSTHMCNFRTDHLSFFSLVNDSVVDIIDSNTNIQSTSSSRGGLSLKKDDCGIDSNLPGANKKGVDYSSSYYDNTCLGEDKIDEKQGVHGFPIEPTCSKYTSELNNSYIFARKNNITTIDLCENANMKGELIRSHMAKMMVNFVENVLKKEIEISDNPECLMFNDISNETSEMKGYITKACQMGLMGLKSDGISVNSSFNPQDIVTRAQFGTVLSRVIWGNKNNVKNIDVPYYINHLVALKGDGIMTKIDNPYGNELRGWVMLMMKRFVE